MTYKRILCAIDFNDLSHRVCARGRELADLSGADVDIIHVVEPMIALPPYELPSLVPQSIDDVAIESAQLHLERIAQEYGLDKGRVHVELGAVRTQITEFAAGNQTDLIVLGEHGRHGIAVLFGSTTNSVVQRALCDVLVVKAD